MTLVKKYAGVVPVLAIAIVAYLLGSRFKIIGSAIFGILIGIALPFFKRPAVLESGIKFTSKRMLQLSIILLGFEMNLLRVLETGAQSLLIMVVTISAALLLAVKLGKALGVPRNAKLLVGVGTAICGGSAIAATAPVIGADDEDIASALSTVFLFNIVAVFLFPALGHLMGMSQGAFGIWAGTAINDTSSVVAAGYTYGEEAGNIAVIVKLARTLMIVPITLGLSIFLSKGKGEGGSFSFAKVFPWFVIGFVLASVITTTGVLPVDVGKMLVKIGKFLIVMAMAAIGLNTNLRKLLTNGRKSILLGVCCWAVVALSSLLLQFILGTLS